MTNSARIGIGRADSNRRRNGAHSRRAADFINGAATVAAGSSSNLAELGSAISSRLFLAAAAAALLSADSADVRRLPNVGPMSKQISWSLWKKRSTDQPGQFRCDEPVRTRWKTIRLRFRAGFTKDSESVCAVRAKQVRAAEKVAIFFCACVWRNILTSRSRAAI